MISAVPVSAWPPLPPEVYARRPAEELPYPLAEPGLRLYATARDALRALADMEVLAPAWGADADALLAAGVTPRFYEVGPGLEPDPDELDRLTSERTRALLLVHQLGFPA